MRAFFVAVSLAYITIILFIAIPQYKFLNAFGDDLNSQVWNNIIKNAIFGGIMPLIITVPIILFVQWLALRRSKKSLSKLDVDKTFS